MQAYRLDSGRGGLPERRHCSRALIVRRASAPAHRASLRIRCPSPHPYARVPTQGVSRPLSGDLRSCQKVERRSAEAFEPRGLTTENCRVLRSVQGAESGIESSHDLWNGDMEEKCTRRRQKTGDWKSRQRHCGLLVFGAGILYVCSGRSGFVRVHCSIVPIHTGLRARGALVREVDEISRWREVFWLDEDGVRGGRGPVLDSVFSVASAFASGWCRGRYERQSFIWMWRCRSSGSSTTYPSITLLLSNAKKLERGVLTRKSKQ